eukprot:c30574_g1_i1 orf=38-202(+)
MRDLILLDYDVLLISLQWLAGDGQDDYMLGLLLFYLRDNINRWRGLFSGWIVPS